MRCLLLNPVANIAAVVVAVILFQPTRIDPVEDEYRIALSTEFLLRRARHPAVNE